MRTRYIALIVVVGLIALWMADVGAASEVYGRAMRSTAG